jgi:hypothetical protein
MKRVKLFEEFTSGASSDGIVNEILDALADDIQYLMGKHEEAFQKHYERPMTAYDKELARLNIIWDMLKAIEIYTLPTDELVTISSRISPKGNLEISAQIRRDGEVYPFNTEVIYAGGYNIQRLHYRYITKTSLPKTGRSSVSDAYEDRIKKLSKLEKLNAEISFFATKIQGLTQEVELNKAKSEKEIWQEITSAKDYYEWPDWAEIVRRGADKNYAGEEDFNSQKKQAAADSFASWKKRNIQWKEDQILAYQKSIARLRKKLEAFI